MRKMPKSLTLSGAAFVTGVMTGLATALLYAPQSGIRTRRQIRRYADQVAAKTSKEVDKAKDMVGGVLEQGKKLVNWQ